MTVPQLTNEDRKKYLKRAAAARAARMELKRKVASGEMKPSEVIAQAQDDPTIGRMRVLELLRAIPGIGDARSEAIMSDLKIADNRRLAGLGRLQHQKLIELLEK